MTDSPGMAAHRPALRPQVLVSGELLHGPRAVHLVKDPETGRSFEVGAKEYFLIARLDGSHSLEEIGSAYAERYGRRLADTHWQHLLGMLGSRGLLAGAYRAGGAAATAATSATPATDAGEERPNSVLRGRLRLVADADDTARRLHRVAGFLLARRWMVPLMVLVAAMETLLVLRAGEVLRDTRELFGHPALLVLVACLLWLSTALHELAHGVVARHYGGRVTEIGLRWRLPVVIMYCTVDNYLYLRTRWHQAATAVAGAVMNLLFLLPFCALWLFVPLDDATHGAMAGLLVIGSVQAAAMLVPLPPLDGYKIVGQLLGSAELAASSRAYLALAVRRDPAAARYPRRARLVYTGFGIGAVLALAAVTAAAVLFVHSLLTV